MDCPRCDSPLLEFEWGERATTACDRCGYLGVPVDHHPEEKFVESWNDALRRFSDET